MEEVPSPCIKICRYDSKGVCFGCRRTLNEIGDWSKYTNEQKQAVIDQLSSRTNVEEMGGFSF
jgi:predicted Fe-S protein YdhL (DUF1289 family)